MKMAFKSKIKWIALFVLILSMVSLVIHLSITKLSGPYSQQSTLMPAIGFNLTPIFGVQISFCVLHCFVFFGICCVLYLFFHLGFRGFVG